MRCCKGPEGNQGLYVDYVMRHCCVRGWPTRCDFFGEEKTVLWDSGRFSWCPIGVYSCDLALAGRGKSLWPGSVCGFKRHRSLQCDLEMNGLFAEYLCNFLNDAHDFGSSCLCYFTVSAVDFFYLSVSWLLHTALQSHPYFAITQSSVSPPAERYAEVPYIITL